MKVKLKGQNTIWIKMMFTQEETRGNGRPPVPLI